MTNIVFDETEVLERLGRIDSQGTYTHYRPLEDAANEFVRWAETPERRVYTSIDVLDEAMRGTAPGELTIIQGFAHSGKTLITTEMLLNNPDVPIVLFTPDETRPLVLTKITSALHGVGAKELERRIQQDDDSARRLLLDTANRYNRLAVFDESVTLLDMSRMFDEAAHVFGETPKAVVFDYADLLDGYEDVKQALTALKAWGKKHETAMFVLHQASRTSGGAGRKMMIDSGAYGGEQQATHVIGVRRKKYMHYAHITLYEEKIANAVNPQSIANYEAKIREIKDVLLPRDENTITISLVKNKRPPCELVDDVDFVIDSKTGRLRRQFDSEDQFGNPIKTTKSALKHLRQQRSYENQEIEYEYF